MSLRSVTKTQLKNGLTVICGQVPETNSFELSVHINTGSRDETEDVSGISHVLEHMMFRGSGLYPNSIKLAQAMEDLGGDSNAMTGHEHTLYWLRGSVRKVEDGFRIFSDFFFNPQFLDFETEKQIILQELASDYNEKGYNIDPDSLGMEALFKTHTLGLPIIGSKESIQNISVDQLRLLRAKKYHPKNSAITLISPLSNDQALRLAQTYFEGEWTHCSGHEFQQRTLIETHKYLNKSHNKSVSSIRLQNNSDNQYMMKLLFPCYGGNSQEVVCQSMIQRILDDGISSRLQSTIRETHGLVYDISCDASPFEEIGTFSIDVTVAQENLDKLFPVLEQELQKFLEYGPTLQELERARFRYLFELDSLHEHPSRVVSREVWNLFVQQDYSLDRERQELESLNANNMTSLARQIFSAPRKAGVLVGPKAKRYRDKLTRLMGFPLAKS